MPANVSQSATSFAFLPTASTPTSTTAAGSRSERSGFAQMLQGQLDNGTRDATQADRGPAEAGKGARSERPRPVERSAAKAPEPVRQRDRSAEPAGDRAPATDTAAKGDTAPAAAESAATADPAAPADAAAPSPAEAAGLAGLPAAIAALMAGTRQAANDAPTDAAAPLADAEQGDMQADSLQNPARGTSTADLAARTSQLAAQLQVRTDSTQTERQAPGQHAAAGEFANHLSAATGVAAASRHAGGSQAATPQLPVHTPAGQAAFADDVGDRVMWMLGRAESKAELVLTPPTLGKVEVSISLNGDQTTAQFVASSQAARDALEQAMPRLREILQQAGISLGQTSVGTSGDQQAAQDESGRQGRGGTAGNAEATGGTAAPQWIRQSEGMVDTFA